MSTLDLEQGDAERAERIAEQQSAGQLRRQRRKVEAEKSGEKKPPASKSTASRTDSDLIGRLNDAFERLASGLESRGDEELSTAIREEKESMSRGLVSLTRSIKPLRRPLVFVISFLEPVIAFWRVGGILARRAIERRQARIHKREAAAASVDYAEQSPVVG